jgi:hypothetical protein
VLGEAALGLVRPLAQHTPNPVRLMNLHNVPPHPVPFDIELAAHAAVVPENRTGIIMNINNEQRYYNKQY